MLRNNASYTHADPTYEVDGVIHCCVANMPGAEAPAMFSDRTGRGLIAGPAVPKRRFLPNLATPSEWLFLYGQCKMGDGAASAEDATVEAGRKRRKMAARRFKRQNSRPKDERSHRRS
jgi:hypothetical protein